MLSIRFHPEKKYGMDEAELSPPYDVVADLLTSDVQHDPAYARTLIEAFERVVRGEEAPMEVQGNAYLIEVNAASTRVSTEFGTQPSCELPTPWLIDALQQWLAYLERTRES